MSTIQFIPIVIVEIIIVFAIFGIWGRKVANPRLFLLLFCFVLVIVDIVIGFVVK
jgi:hypothetical protein